MKTLNKLMNCIFNLLYEISTRPLSKLKGGVIQWPFLKSIKLCKSVSVLTAISLFGFRRRVSQIYFFIDFIPSSHH